MQDQGNTTWYEADDLLSNASNHDTNGEKFMDWRLPTKRELNLMYGVYTNGNGANLQNLQPILPGYYWSSTELDYDSAWGQDFSDGGGNYYGKLSTINVRAVRAF